MRRPARDRRLKPCRYCRRNFGLEVETRSEAECEYHHAVTFCKVHGITNCAGKRDDCSGSARYPGAYVPEAV